jgi:hypothetical protein
MADDSLTQKTRELLNQRADTLPEATLGRLRAARREALAVAGSRRARSWIIPAGGLVAASLVAMLAIGLWTHSSPVTGIEDVDILAAKDSPDFYSEDYEFYLWLDGQKRAG